LGSTGIISFCSLWRTCAVIHHTLPVVVACLPAQQRVCVPGRDTLTVRRVIQSLVRAYIEETCPEDGVAGILHVRTRSVTKVVLIAAWSKVVVRHLVITSFRPTSCGSPGYRDEYAGEVITSLLALCLYHSSRGQAHRDGRSYASLWDTPHIAIPLCYG
jgi:hypothetical protein